MLEKMLQVRTGPAGEVPVMSCSADGDSRAPSAFGFVLISAAPVNACVNRGGQFPL